MSEDENAAHAVDIIDSGNRTEAQKAAIHRIGQGVADRTFTHLLPDIELCAQPLNAMAIEAVLLAVRVPLLTLSGPVPKGLLPATASVPAERVVPPE